MFHKKVVIGDPAEEIVKVVDREGIDVIIVATRGRTDYFPFGSVTS